MNPVVRFLHDPTVVRDWTADDWNRFVPMLRHARLLGRCHYLLERHGLTEHVPQRLRDQLRGALAQTRYLQTQALRELRHVVRLLRQQAIDVVALKGVAYLAAQLPPAAWRSLSDIDLLVRQSDVDAAERVLQQAGWRPSGEFDAYDRHYYRDWMHEVPPLRHRLRETEVDLHHNLSPPVSRIRIDARLLWDGAQRVIDRNGSQVGILAPADLLLHNAVHLFMNDELRGGLRDVMDFRDLYEHFAARDAGFADQLLARAAVLGCGRPLYYAATTAERLTGLRLPSTTRQALARWAPAAPLAWLMRRLIDAVLAPQRLGSRSARLAQNLLYVRSHWVRMPPGMLIRHLMHKALKRRRPGLHDAEMPG